MQLIAHIHDGIMPDHNVPFRTREASRAILLDVDGRIPLLFVGKGDYYKLPGGGIDTGESPLQALVREAQEEVGCEVEVISEVGEIIEFRGLWNLEQTSYCYIARIVSHGAPQFTEEEQENGFEIVWMTFDEALECIQKNTPRNYAGTGMQKRDALFFQKAGEIISSLS